MVAGIPIREPYPGELEYFKNNPTVGGMATEDNKIILNPYSTLTDEQKKSVALNEASRIYMRRQENKPNFKLTPEQEEYLNSTTYKTASPEDRLATVAARLVSGDPSVKNPTPEQEVFSGTLRSKMNLTPIPDQPLGYGELGTLRGKNGSMWTERMVGISDPRLYGGRSTNIPLLQKGQVDVDKMIEGAPVTREQYQRAIDRAVERVREGESFSNYPNIMGSVEGALNRHKILDLMSDPTTGTLGQKGMMHEKTRNSYELPDILKDVVAPRNP